MGSISADNEQAPSPKLETRNSPSLPAIKVAAAIIVRNDQILIAQRPAGKHKAGYWEFPGGKIEAGETSQQALCRELKEELNIEVMECKPFTQVDFDYPEKRVQLSFFMVTEFKGQAEGLEGQNIRWIKRHQLIDYQFPEANLVVIKMLLNQVPEIS